MSYKGKFTPQNPEKYVGDITSIRWLSLWERGVMHWLDKNEYIKRWGSEIIKVKYIKQKVILKKFACYLMLRTLLYHNLLKSPEVMLNVPLFWQRKSLVWNAKLKH